MKRPAKSHRQNHTWLIIAVTEGMSWLVLGLMSYFIPWNTLVMMARPLSGSIAWLLGLIPHYLVPHATRFMAYGILMTMVSAIALTVKRPALRVSAGMILGAGAVVPVMWIWIPDPAFLLCSIELLRDRSTKNQ